VLGEKPAAGNTTGPPALLAWCMATQGWAGTGMGSQKEESRILFRNGQKGAPGAAERLVWARIGPRRFTRAMGGLVGGLESGAAPLRCAARGVPFVLAFGFGFLWPLGFRLHLGGMGAAGGGGATPPCVGPCHRFGTGSSRSVPGWVFRPRGASGEWARKYQ
jgi:hypothetical protein